MDFAIHDRTDIKIFVLFLLNEINYPLEYTALCEVIAENEYVGAFDFAECFAELCELSHIERIEKDGKSLYRITETGRMVASELQGNLLESIRENSRRSAARVLSLYMRGATVSSEIRRRPDGMYSVRCAITEKEGPLLSVEMAASTQLEAEKIKTYFESKPENIFRGVLSVMTGEVDYLFS